MTPEKSIAVIGLSDAGKSTWLGALCDCMEAGPAARGDSLRFDGMPEDFEQLGLLRNAILEGRYPPHTPPATSNKLTFPLVLSRDGTAERFVLDVSDYSGERVAGLYNAKDLKRWDEAWEERASRPLVAVLIRADDLKRLQRRSTSAKTSTAGFLPADLVPDDDEEASRRPPTALALIESLQAMRAWRGVGLGHRRLSGLDRVAVLLTAWDSVPVGDRKNGATSFLDTHAPMLASWLRANVHPDDLQVFGLSATGGDLRNEDHANRVKKDGIADIAYVEWGSPSETKHDVALPLEWLLSGKLPSNHAS